jgi:RNA polymerase sigma-70 factor (ECF subfamily)
MPDLPPSEIARLFRAEYGRAVAVLIRLCGDIDLAEEAVQDAFAAAVETLAGRGAAAEPGRLDHHDRPPPGDRPVAM